MNLLLDVDGVLVRDQKILDITRRNISSYVRMKIPRVKNPDRLREYLYKRYGHTGYGMTKMFGIPTPDFNSYVYDKDLMGSLVDLMCTEQFTTDAKTLRAIMDRGHIVTLFSNAPPLWTLPIAESIDQRVRVAHFPGLKPNPIAYASIRTNRRTNIFVDDSLKNLKPVTNLPGWVPIHFSDQIQDWSYPTIQYLDQLLYVLDMAYDDSTQASL